MNVKCPSCGSVTKMARLAGMFFHLGSFKGDTAKHFTGEAHKPVCLWCGFVFEPVVAALEIEGEE